MRTYGYRVALVALLAPLVVAAPASAETTTAAGLLSRLAVATEGGSTTYARSAFRDWYDADDDGCDTREEVLLAETRVTATVGAGCAVSSGRWLSWYDGATWTAPSDVDIDHVVALKEAWESGARSWSSTDRGRFSNDLGHAWALDAVTDNVNASKSDRDPAEWLPPLTSVRCDYAVHWVTVKYRWRLTVDTTERSALSSLLTGSCGSRTVTVPTRAI